MLSEAWPRMIREVIHELAKEGQEQHMKRPQERSVAKKRTCKDKAAEQRREHIWFKRLVEVRPFQDCR